MPLSFIGAAAGLATTVTPPAHVAGDLLLCYAARSAGDSTQVDTSGNSVTAGFGS